MCDNMAGSNNNSNHVWADEKTNIFCGLIYEWVPLTRISTFQVARCQGDYLFDYLFDLMFVNSTSSTFYRIHLPMKLASFFSLQPLDGNALNLDFLFFVSFIGELSKESFYAEIEN